MLNIPTNLDAWHPHEVSEWFDTLGPDVIGAEYAAAQRAVTVALLGEEAAAEVHGPVSS